MAGGARQNGTAWHRRSEEGGGLYIDAGETGGNDQESGEWSRQAKHEGNERRRAFQNKTGSHGTSPHHGGQDRINRIEPLGKKIPF